MLYIFFINYSYLNNAIMRVAFMQVDAYIIGFYNVLGDVRASICVIFMVIYDIMLTMRWSCEIGGTTGVSFVLLTCLSVCRDEFPR